MAALYTQTMETLTHTLVDGVATLTLNRPAVKNAINRQMADELADYVEAVGRDSAVRVLLIRGAGGDFCAGGDVSGMQGPSVRTPEQARLDMQRYRRMTLALHGLDKPVVASVDGVAYGAGFSLVMLADIVVVSERVRLSMAFQRIGLLPDCGAMYTLPRVVGLQRAKELVLSGRVLGAAEACALGIAMEAVPPDALAARAEAIAQSLAGASPTAVALAKRALSNSLGLSLEAMLEVETSGQAIALGTDYLAESRRRFLAKEPAQFQWPTA
jgi:2-(1,2-epoxy-1,2-dihydrophenyl)acetyl-CoA isomerase